MNILKNNVDSVALNAEAFVPKSLAQPDFSVKAGDYTVVPGDVVVIFSGAAATITLPNPGPENAGRSLIVLTRTNHAIATSASVPYVDIELDPTTGTTQTTLLTATGGSWVHLMSNGNRWVAIAKNVATPN